MRAASEYDERGERDRVLLAAAARRRSGSRRSGSPGAAGRSTTSRRVGDRAGLVEDRARSRSNVAQSPYASGTPQRGKKRVKICVRAEWSPGVHVLDERRARRPGQQLRAGRRGARPSTFTARSAPRIADVDVQAERVVPPDDVAEQLVAAPVVRRVDDPLLLPGAPGMRARRAERDAELVRERAQLGSPLGDAAPRPRRRSRSGPCGSRPRRRSARRRGAARARSLRRPP